jgi:hypothetical protein
LKIFDDLRQPRQTHGSITQVLETCQPPLKACLALSGTPVSSVESREIGINGYVGSKLFAKTQTLPYQAKGGNHESPGRGVKSRCQIKPLAQRR